MVDTVDRMNDDDIIELVKVRAVADVPALRLHAGDESVLPIKSVTRWFDRGLLTIVDPQVKRWGRLVGATIEPITE